MASRRDQEEHIPNRLLVTQLAGIASNGHGGGGSAEANGTGANGRLPAGVPGYGHDNGSNGAAPGPPPLAPRVVPRNEMASEFDLREVLAMISRWKWAGLGVAVLAAALTVAYVHFFWEPEATATTEMRHQGEPRLPLQEMLAASSSDNLTADTLTMRSPANFEVLAKIVDALDELPPERRSLPLPAGDDGEAVSDEALAELEAAGAPFGAAHEELFLSPSDSFSNWLVLDFASGRAVEPEEIDAQIDSFKGNLLLIRPDDHRLLLESYWGVDERSREEIRSLTRNPSALVNAVSTSASSDTRTIRVRVTHGNPHVSVFFANALPVSFNSFSQRKSQVRRSLAVGIAESSLRQSRQSWINAHQELDEEMERVNRRLAERASLINVAGLEPEEVARMIGELNFDILMLEWEKHALADQWIELERERLRLYEDGWLDPNAAEISWRREERRVLLAGGGSVADRSGMLRRHEDRISALEAQRERRAEKIEQAASDLREICERISELPIDDPRRSEWQEEFEERQAAFEEATKQVDLTSEAHAAVVQLRGEARTLRRSSVELNRKAEVAREKLAELNVQRSMLVEENRSIKQRQAQVQALFDRMIRSANLLQEAQLNLASDTSHLFDWQRTASVDMVSHSTPTMLLVTGSLLAVLLGLLTIFVLHQLDHRVVSTAQLAKLTNLPVLGRVPRLKRRDISHLLRRSDSDALRASQFHPSMAMLAFNLAHAVRRPNGGMVCLATSSVPTEGKSLISRQLAALYAAKGLRSCLLLADCHQISADSLDLLGESAETAPAGFIGLVNAYNETGVEPEWERGIHASRIRNLSIVLPGEGDVDTNTHFESPGFAAMMEYLRTRFDVILMDSPPVSLSTDPLTLGALVDTALLVVRVGVSQIEGVSNTLNQVQFVNLPVAGIVFNDIRRERRYGYSYYGYYYGYSGGRNGSRTNIPAAALDSDPDGSAAAAEGATASGEAPRASHRRHAAEPSSRNVSVSPTTSHPNGHG